MLGRERAQDAPVLVADLVRTRPSRGVKPMCSRHFCQSTLCPSTVKLGPSGWVISIGFTSARSRWNAAVAGLEHELRDVIAGLSGNRDDAVIVDLDDLHRVEVDHREQALDRTGVVVLARRPHPRQRPRSAAGRRRPRSRVAAGQGSITASEKS